MSGGALAPRQARRGPGRPPEANGEETQREIMRVARHLFAVHGYAGTSTRMIAVEVGVTPAALHHYFGRKHNLALAVWQWTTDEEFARLYEAVGGVSDFVEKAHTLLAVSLESLRRDREASLFISSIREDARRTPELDSILDDRRLPNLVRDIVAHGVASNALREEDSAQVSAAISAVVFGATLLAADLSPRRVDQMVTGCKRLLDGSLLTRRSTR
jgi:AcrR family transcriptional regulator